MVAKTSKRARKKRWLIVLGCLALICTFLVIHGLSNLNPILISMAEARARQLAVETINRAVAEVMGEAFHYSDLVNVVTDADGRVSMIQANTMLMNRLALQAALVTQRNLGELAEQGVRLPLGAALGIGLFSGSGPQFNVRVVPVGSVTTRFVTAFETAGINQTRHEILLETSTLMRIVIPTGADTVSVSAYVPVAESIIVGEVPDSYINILPQNPILNLLP